MKELKALIQVKKLIALMLTVAFIILTLRGTVSSSEFMAIFTMIAGFYYGQSTAKNINKE